MPKPLVTCLSLLALSPGCLSVELLQDLGVDIMDSSNNVPSTFAAVKYGYADLVADLITGDATAKTDSHGNTLIGIAAEFGHEDVVKILLVHGEDIGRRD